MPKKFLEVEERKCGGDMMYNEYFGEYIGLFSVRSKKKGFGATTTYISYALDSKEIDGAIVVKADEKWKPMAVVAKTSEELKTAVGTKWVITPMVNAIIDALRVERMERIAIIGTPCQCQAIRDIMEYPMQLGDMFERIKIIVGLFCMGSFTQDGFKTMVERKMGIALPDIERAEIKSDKFVVKLRNGECKEISIEDVKGDIKFACLTCEDFTAKSADISFGNAGSTNGWRSTIVRNKVAMEILERAKDAGYIEYEELPLSGIEEIKRLAEEKVKRAIRMRAL